MSLLATVELLVEPVELELAPLLARPLVLSLCEDEVLDVLDGEVLLLIEPELCAEVSLLATVEPLVEPVDPDALPLLAKPLVLPVCEEEASEAEPEDVLVLAVPLVLSLLATLALVDGEVELLPVDGEEPLNEPEAEPDAEPLTFALMFVFEFWFVEFWFELLATLLLEDGEVDELLSFEPNVELVLLLFDGEVLPLLLVPKAAEPVPVPVLVLLFCVLLL